MAKSASKPTQPEPAEKASKMAADSPDAVTDEQIAERAYYIFLERGGAGGSEVDDWLQAEQELRRNK
jgi:hypothetical protein